MSETEGEEIWTRIGGSCTGWEHRTEGLRGTRLTERLRHRDRDERQIPDEGPTTLSSSDRVGSKSKPVEGSDSSRYGWSQAGFWLLGGDGGWAKFPGNQEFRACARLIDLAEADPSMPQLLDGASWDLLPLSLFTPHPLSSPPHPPHSTLLSK